MSFVATLKFDGNEYNVLSCSYAVSQGTDNANRASTSVRCESIVVSMIVDDASKIYQWAADSYKTQDGTIEFNKEDDASKLKELKFEKGLCSGYSESFTANQPDPVIVSITITPQKVTMYDATIDMTVKK